MHAAQKIMQRVKYVKKGRFAGIEILLAVNVETPSQFFCFLAFFFIFHDNY